MENKFNDRGITCQSMYAMTDPWHPLPVSLQEFLVVA
jgi:hypothetical protein